MTNTTGNKTLNQLENRTKIEQSW